MLESSQSSNIGLDDPVDQEIAACLDLDQPKSFFLFAGAGSGKTRSLKEALDGLKSKYSDRLRLVGQRIGVITYTNAACDEIKSRIKHDPLVEVSTIHSFAWLLIGGFHHDIREWLRVSLAEEILEIEAEEANGRVGTQASRNRQAQIASKTRRLDRLDEVRRFTYNPTGENTGRGSLNHSEVIKMCSDFLMTKTGLRKILVNQYPILLIDECQDTNKHLVDVLLHVQSLHENEFALGLLGDTMQRIYSDGKVRIEESIPQNWARPAKSLNHRCPSRIVTLINKIRSSVDEQQQVPRSDCEEGHVRFFLIRRGGTEKQSIEEAVCARMAAITDDAEWLNSDGVKALILEHHMAAIRMGFLDMFTPLHEIEGYRTGLLDGSLPPLKFFTSLVFPLTKACKDRDRFAIARILREESPLLSASEFRANENNQRALLNTAQEAVKELEEILEGENPKFLDVLHCIWRRRLFTVHETLTPFCGTRPVDRETSEEIDPLSKDQQALKSFLETPFSQIENYIRYVSGVARFGTHQGVKGLEFPRVMVVIDDEEARGFLFSYGKLLGEKAKSETDLRNELEGRETTIDRTRRLFYVTCSRAEKSLAIVAYTDSPAAIKEMLLANEWCSDDEIIEDSEIS